MASGDRRNKVVNNILNKVKILFRKGKFKSNKNTDPSSAITESETRTTTELEAPPHPTAATPTLPSSAAAEDTGSSSARATGFPEPAPTTRTPIEHFWLCSTRAPIWNAALESLKTHHLRQYKELQELENKSAEPRSIQDMGKLLELKEETPESRAIVQRAKQYLPSLASVRGIAMTAAALDPHKIAPIVCASVFFTIELAFNTLSPEAKRKIQSTVFETINTINEGISFESNFPQKNLSAIKGDIKTLNRILSD